MYGWRKAVSWRGSSLSTSRKPAPPPTRLYQPLIRSGWFIPASCCWTTRWATCWRVVLANQVKAQYQSMSHLLVRARRVSVTHQASQQGACQHQWLSSLEHVMASVLKDAVLEV